MFHQPCKLIATQCISLFWFQKKKKKRIQKTGICLCSSIYWSKWKRPTYFRSFSIIDVPPPRFSLACRQPFFILSTWLPWFGHLFIVCLFNAFRSHFIPSRHIRTHNVSIDWIFGAFKSETKCGRKRISYNNDNNGIHTHTQTPYNGLKLKIRWNESNHRMCWSAQR